MNILNSLDSIDYKRHHKYSYAIYQWVANSPKAFLPYNSEIIAVKTKEGVIYLGALDLEYAVPYFIGSAVGNILSCARDATVIYTDSKDFLDSLEVIDNFWEKYIEMSVCVFDPDHILDLSMNYGRWSYSEDDTVRKCNWCENCVQFHEEYTFTQTRYRWIKR